jgi:DNA-binding GntR family transcriptional regulator
MLWGNLSATANKRTVEQDIIDIEEHRAIIDALEKRNATEAERVMRQHIENAGNRLLLILMNDATSTPEKQP